MSFDSLPAFLAMGGHGAYVWTVYVTAVLLLAGNFARISRERRRILRLLRSLHAGSDPESAQTLPGP